MNVTTLYWTSAAILGIPMLRLFFSPALVWRLAVMAVAMNVAGWAFVFYEHPELFTQLQWAPMELRWDWPRLSFPQPSEKAPYPLVALVQVGTLALLWNHRNFPGGAWCSALGGALVLLLGTQTLSAYLCYWQLTTLIALLCLARMTPIPTDAVSTQLLRLVGILALGHGMLLYGLVPLCSDAALPQSLLQDNPIANPRAVVWLAVCLLTLGAVYQALESDDLAWNRTALVLVVAGLAVPGTWFMLRIPALPSVYVTYGLSFVVLAAGILAFRSQSVENLLKGLFLCSQSLLLLNHNLNAPIGGTTLAMHLGSLLVLATLLSRIPAFVKVPRTAWIRGLEGLHRQAVACLALAMVGVALGCAPLGFGGFDFLALLQVSVWLAVLVCLGIVGAVGGTLTVLSGAWFSDLFFKWPTRTYTVLARRYFGG